MVLAVIVKGGVAVRQKRVLDFDLGFQQTREKREKRIDYRRKTLLEDIVCSLILLHVC